MPWRSKQPRTQPPSSDTTRPAAGIVDVPDAGYDMIARHLAGRTDADMQPTGSAPADVARLMQTGRGAHQALTDTGRATPCRLLIRDGDNQSTIISTTPSIGPRVNMSLTKCAATNDEGVSRYMEQFASEIYVLLGMYASIKRMPTAWVAMSIARKGGGNNLEIMRYTDIESRAGLGDGTDADSDEEGFERVAYVETVTIQYDGTALFFHKNKNDRFETDTENLTYMNSILAQFIPENEWCHACFIHINPHKMNIKVEEMTYRFQKRPTVHHRVDFATMGVEISTPNHRN